MRLQSRCVALFCRLDRRRQRWQIYTATSRFVDAINNDPEHVYSYRNDFNAGTSNAEFLFDSDVVNYIQQIRSRAAHMETAHTLSENERKDEAARTRNIEAFAADRSWLIEQVKSGGAMHKTFAPYLGFANIKA
jgi:hypothetical protein